MAKSCPRRPVSESRSLFTHIYARWISPFYSLKKKVAGAQVLFTDPIFDVAGFEQWMQEVLWLASLPSRHPG